MNYHMNQQIRPSYRRDEILKEGREIISERYSHVTVKKKAKVNGKVKELYCHPDVAELARALELANDVWKDRTDIMDKSDVQALVSNLMNEFFYKRLKTKK